MVAWLILQILSTQQSVNSVRHSMDNTVATLQSSISQNQAKAQVNDESLLQKIELVLEQQEGAEVLASTRKQLSSANKLVGEKDKKLQQNKTQISSMQLQRSAYKLYMTVLEAELSRRDKNSAVSSEKLKSIKSGVWKLSEKVPDSKDKLRGLMAPIDVISSAWKQGNFSKDSSAIQQVLLAVIKKIG